MLHLALENLSRLAIECLESNRLCSYTEKSTRYQIFDAFYVPAAIAASGPCRPLPGARAGISSRAYQASLEPVRRVIESWHPRKADETERRLRARISLEVHRRLPVPAPVRDARQRGDDGQRAGAGARHHQDALASAGGSARDRHRGQAGRAAEVPDTGEVRQPQSAISSRRPGLTPRPEHSPPTGHSDRNADTTSVRLIHYDRDAETRVLAAMPLPPQRGTVS